MADGPAGGGAWAPPPQPKLLSGGNPQVPKGDGDAPVQYYIDHMPDWKRAVGRRLDALIVKHVPEVRKAVRWNTPFYGVGDGWFLGWHCFDQYVKVTWLRGKRLDPMPPVDSKSGEVRYLHVTEDGLDEEQFVAWLRQAAALEPWGKADFSRF